MNRWERRVDDVERAAKAKVEREIYEAHGDEYGYLCLGLRVAGAGGGSREAKARARATARVQTRRG